MAAYRRVYDSRHLQADCQEPGSAPEPYSTLGNRVWATFTFYLMSCMPWMRAIATDSVCLSVGHTSEPYNNG